MADKGINIKVIVETVAGDVFELDDEYPNDGKFTDFFLDDGTDNAYCVMFNSQIIEVYPNIDAAKSMVAFHKTGVDDGDPYDMYHVEVVSRKDFGFKFAKALETFNGKNFLKE
jgi:hypothetical protein